MINLRTHTHAQGSMTEVLACERASRGSGSIMARILSDIRMAGPDGLTPDEVAAAGALLINTTRRRFTDLWKSGQIRHHPLGLTRPNGSGNPCRAWVIGADPSVSERQPSRLTRLLAAEYSRGYQDGRRAALAEMRSDD
jgi:hypothetical protein